MKTTKRLVIAGLIVTLTAGLTATLKADSMVEAAQKLTAAKAMQRAQLRRATPRARAIVNYAMSVNGQTIGNGQCTELITAALKAGRARLGNFSDPENYNWGTKRPAGEAIRLGDIIQFEGCTFVTTTTTANSGTFTSTQNMPHHTAIVGFVQGNKVLLIHQNLSGSPVKMTSLNLDDMTAGRYTVWIASARRRFGG